MIDLPIELASLRQFCCRDQKQPIIKKPVTGRLTSSWKGNTKEGWKGSDGYLTLCEAIAYVANGETYWTQNEKFQSLFSWNLLLMSGFFSFFFPFDTVKPPILSPPLA